MRLSRLESRAPAEDAGRPELSEVMEQPPVAGVWAPLPEASDYWISDQGEVWSWRCGRLLKRTRNADGYCTVSVDGKSRYAHSMVLEAFVGPRPAGHVARHLNDVPGDDRLDNLSWGSRRENALDIARNGNQLGTRGEAHARARMTEEKVRAIRAWYSYGFGPKEIASWYGLSREGCRAICTRRSWQHVAD